jgi:MFS family permease
MLLGLGLAAIYPILIVSAANLFPESRGSVTGYLAAAGAFGAIVLPAFQGWLTSEREIGMVVVLVSTSAMGAVLWSIPLKHSAAK